jgi:hypothetical protein
MNLKSISLLLVPALLMLMMVAYGGTPQPTPALTTYIETTVGARLQEKQAQAAALEAKARSTESRP